MNPVDLSFLYILAAVPAVYYSKKYFGAAIIFLSVFAFGNIWFHRKSTHFVRLCLSSIVFALSYICYFHLFKHPIIVFISIVSFLLSFDMKRKDR